MTDGPWDFFISYNSSDVRWARWIAWVLEEEGYRTVVQDWDIRPGTNFVLEMQQATERAERVIAVLSPDYLDAVFTQPEWAAVFVQDPTGLGRRLVPVMVRDCQPRGLLTAIVYIGLVGLDRVHARQCLLAGVDPGRAKPLIEPSFPGDEPDPGPAVTMPVPSPLVSPPAAQITVRWRADLDIPGSGDGFAILEVHLVPLDGEAAIGPFVAEYLASVGRTGGVFQPGMRVDRDADALWTCARSTDVGCRRGLAVSYGGQRSAWVPLPGSSLAVLDRRDLAERVRSLLRLLIGLDVGKIDRAAVAVAVGASTVVGDLSTLDQLRQHASEVSVDLVRRLA